MLRAGREEAAINRYEVPLASLAISLTRSKVIWKTG